MTKKLMVLLFLITLVFALVGTSIVSAGDEPLLVPGSFCSNYNFGSPSSGFWFMAWCVGDGIGWSFDTPV